MDALVAWDSALLAEEGVLQLLLREQIGYGSVLVARLDRLRLRMHCDQHARRSVCQCLTLSVTEPTLEFEYAGLARLTIAPRELQLLSIDERTMAALADDSLSAWTSILERLLHDWQ